MQNMPVSRVRVIIRTELVLFYSLLCPTDYIKYIQITQLRKKAKHI